MNFVEHLPILLIIIPLLAAPLCILSNHAGFSWFISCVSCAASFICSLMLLEQLTSVSVISYSLGGWEPPWGIEYRVDLLTVFLLLLLTGISTLVLIFARYSVDQEISKNRVVPFYATLLLAITGLNGICISGDVFNVFVFLEISSIASYTLISMGRDRRALNAAFKYLVMGTIGATFILIGIGFLYMKTGTLNMQDLASRLPELYDSRTIRAGFAFLTVGIGLKLALFPLHLWLPNAYAYAPSVVSALLAATATKVAVYMLLRFLFSVFSIDFSLQAMPLNMLLILLGSAAVVSASIVAIFQVNIKRLLAYSSVAQLGYIALAIGLANQTGITAAMLHLFNHALMKGALFLALGAMIYKVGSAELQASRGMIRQMPLTALAIIIGGLSLIGVPGTAGFISKWFMIQAALEKGWWPLAILILLGSLLAVIYVWKIVESLFFSATQKTVGVQEAPLTMLVPVWILVIANLYFGIFTELTVDLANTASSLLISGGAL